jgi:hypothetical protein
MRDGEDIEDLAVWRKAHRFVLAVGCFWGASCITPFGNGLAELAPPGTNGFPQTWRAELLRRRDF